MKRNKPDPRRRRAKLRASNERHRGFLFSNPREVIEDLGIVGRVMAKHGYRLPQEVYDTVIKVSHEFANDENREDKNRLRAVNILRMVIKDATEMELMRAEMDAIKKGEQPDVVIVREDSEFFGNDAHEKAEHASQGSSKTPEQEAGNSPS